MKTKTLLTVILSIILASCAPVSNTTPIETLVPTATITLSPIPPTPTATPEPSANSLSEAGPKDGERHTVSENGLNYEYVYNAELGQWEREVGTIILFDVSLRNYVPYSISTLENVEAEHSFMSISHKDNTDINTPDGYLTRTFKPELEKRYFQDDPRKNTLTNKELQTALQMEMQGMGTGEHTQAYIDIIVANGTPEGQVVKVKLSQTTGIHATIMSEDDIIRLGGANVIELRAHDNGQFYTFFVEVYGVDELGNELVRIAFKDPLNKIPESIFRKVLFSIPGNLVDHKDQREQGFSNVAQIFAQYSEKINDDGTYDVHIDLAPPVQP